MWGDRKVIRIAYLKIKEKVAGEDKWVIRSSSYKKPFGWEADMDVEAE